MKITQAYYCKSCGYQVSKWMGKCSQCGQWNTFELKKDKPSNEENKFEVKHPKCINDIAELKFSRIKTQCEELNKTFGGGIVEGSVTLLGGEPGVGKSTLLIMLGQLELKEGKVLYISGEETQEQVAHRIRRVDESSKISILAEKNWKSIKKTILVHKPNLVFIDSIQTLYLEDLNSSVGSVSQIKELIHEVVEFCKSINLTCILIGHITKEGSLAGPKLLEHMVDTVLLFKKSNPGDIRILSVIKNRFGAADEVGLFRMHNSGFSVVKNPITTFINKQDLKSFGKTFSCLLEGNRPIVYELQSLVARNRFGTVKRLCSNFDNNRFLMLLAIIEKNLNIPLVDHDVFLNVLGPKQLSTKELDLAVIFSVLSSKLKKSIENNFFFIGELGLHGEIRPLQNFEKRLLELNSLGKSKVFSNANSSEIEVFSHLKNMVENIFSNKTF